MRLRKNLKKIFVRKYVLACVAAIMLLLTLVFAVQGADSENERNESRARHHLAINEIMSNPSGSDTGREWIELIIGCGQDINISALRFNESNIKHRLYQYNEMVPCGYVIICNDCELFSAENNITNNISLLKSSFSLSNDGEYISILEDDMMLSEIDYNNVPDEGTIEGHSLAYSEGFWRLSVYGGTPGYDNVLYYMNISENSTIINNTLDNNSTINITKINDTIINETTQNNITINNTINNTTNNITINNTINNTTNNITINNTINNTTNNITTNNTINNTTNNTPEIIEGALCNINLSIVISNEKGVYDEGEQIRFKNKVTADKKINYTIDYWVEDLFGDILKPKTTTSNSNEKSHTPKIKEKDKVLILKNKLIKANCTITPESITEYSKSIIVINKDYEPEQCDENTHQEYNQKCDDTVTGQSTGEKDRDSYIEVSSRESANKYDIKAEIYKGNTRKSALDIYLIDSSGKKTADKHININNAYCSTTMTWSIDKEDIGCEKNYELVIEGLDLTDKTSLMYECKNDTSEKDHVQLSESNKTEYNKPVGVQLGTYKHNESNEITGQSIYESETQKSKNYALIGIIILSLSITITAAWHIRKRLLYKAS